MLWNALLKKRIYFGSTYVLSGQSFDWWVGTEETQRGGDGLGHNEVELSDTHWKWFLIMQASVKKNAKLHCMSD